MPFRLQHVSIPRPPGSDGLTRQFYGELLGMKEAPAPHSVRHLDVLWFKGAGDTELHIFSETPGDDRSARHFCLVTDELAQLRAKLAAAGYQPYDVEPIPGRQRFFCRDPFGNTIEFTSIQDMRLAYQTGTDQ